MFCTKCGKQIPDDSDFCTGCGAPVSPPGPDTASKVFKILVPILLVIFVVSGVFVMAQVQRAKEGPAATAITTEPPETFPAGHTSMDGIEYRACAIARQMVMERLKAPSTAKFPNPADCDYRRYDDLILVIGYVDSQNGFGAMLRNYWIVQYQVSDASFSEYREHYIKIGDLEEGSLVSWPDDAVQTSVKVTEPVSPYPHGPGTYKVGKDLPAGEYELISEAGKRSYFEICSDSSGTLDSILYNENFDSFRFFSVEDGQYLSVKNARFIEAENALVPSPSSKGYRIPGTYRVGIDMEPGEYQLIPEDGERAYYELSYTAANGNYDIYANDNFSEPIYLTVEEGQYLTTVRCKFCPA